MSKINKKLNSNQCFNAKNERIKHRYFKYLVGAKQKSTKSADQARKMIMKFEDFTHYGDFSNFNSQIAIGFKEYLLHKGKNGTGEIYSQHTVNSALANVRDFYIWLSNEQGFRKAIKPNDIAYLKPSLKELAMTRTQGFRNFPTIDQIKTVIFAMPSETDIQKRDRALIAFIAITAVRDGVICGLKLKHINLARELVHQNPMDMETKYSKEIFTFFFQIDDEIKAIFVDYFKWLQKEKLFGMNDPLFPKAKVSFEKIEITKFHASGAAMVYKIFKEAFEMAGVEYFEPHTFRHTLVHYGEDHCKTPAEFKAWSQNLGHENVSTTFGSYGRIDVYNQGNLIKKVGK
jgi:integrase/recombinase XerD